MTILNVGGAGYIGSVATEKFIQNGYKVIVLDDLSTGFKQLVHPQAKFIHGSMLDYKLLDNIFKNNKIDFVTLYAAKIIVPESMEKPISYYETNIIGLINVLKVMKKNKVNNILFASSAAVYGKNNKMPLNELSKTNPCNPYGTSKLICEKIITSICDIHKINYVIFRFFNVAGASDNGKYGMLKKHPSLLIPCINKAIINNDPINIFGNKYKTKDGTCLRDYIHVEDLSNAALLALKYLNKNNSNIFCLGTNKGYTVMDIVKIYKKCLCPKLKYTIKPNRSGDPDKLIASNNKIKKILKWKIKYNLEDMIISDYNFRKKYIK